MKFTVCSIYYDTRKHNEENCHFHFNNYLTTEIIIKRYYRNFMFNIN